jgi:hypothetical protein
LFFVCIFALTAAAALASDISSLTTRLNQCNRAELQRCETNGTLGKAKSLSESASKQLAAYWSQLTIMGGIATTSPPAEYVVCFYEGKTLLTKESISFLNGTAVAGTIGIIEPTDLSILAGPMGTMGFDASNAKAQQLRAFLRNQFPNSSAK